MLPSGALAHVFIHGRGSTTIHGGVVLEYISVTLTLTVDGEREKVPSSSSPNRRHIYAYVH